MLLWDNNNNYYYHKNVVLLNGDTTSLKYTLYNKQDQLKKINHLYFVLLNAVLLPAPTADSNHFQDITIGLSNVMLATLPKEM